MHGGIAQGAGQALLEGIMYDRWRSVDCELHGLYDSTGGRHVSDQVVYYFYSHRLLTQLE